MRCQEADAERPWAARVPSPFPDDGSVLGVSLPAAAVLAIRSAFSMTARAILPHDFTDQLSLRSGFCIAPDDWTAPAADFLEHQKIWGPLCKFRQCV